MSRSHELPRGSLRTEESLLKVVFLWLKIEAKGVYAVSVAAGVFVLLACHPLEFPMGAAKPPAQAREQTLPEDSLAGKSSKVRPQSQANQVRAKRASRGKKARSVAQTTRPNTNRLATASPFRGAPHLIRTYDAALPDLSDALRLVLSLPATLLNVSANAGVPPLLLKQARCIAEPA
jgi:hypothetical protein